MVEEEAARAESEPEDENGEEEEGEESEEEGEEEGGSQPENEASMEKALKAFESENARHERALQKLMGDDWQAFALCPGCAGIGFRAIEAMPIDPDRARCEKCKGHGMLLTGSVNESYVVVPCDACEGQGFIIRVQMPEQPAPFPGPVARFDPYTGELLPTDALPYAAPISGQWAPGYTPPATSG